MRNLLKVFLVKDKMKTEDKLREEEIDEKQRIEVYDDDYIRDKKDKAIIDNLNNERVATLKEFKSLSKKVISEGMKFPLGNVYNERDIKEFIKRLLTPNNISRGFVEVSTIKYYAGDELI